MNLMKKIYKRPIGVCTIAVVALALGILFTFQMPTALLPNIAYPALGVTVAYPGASAETCDEELRPVIEGTIKTLSNVNSLTSYSIENACISAVVFDYDTDIDAKISELRDKFALVTFPSACYDPIYTKLDFNGMAVATVSLYNTTDVSIAYKDADALKEKLLAVENVASVSVYGVPNEQIVITPINGLEMAGLAIIQTLSADTQLNIPLGTLEENGGKVAFRNEFATETIEDIENTPVQIPLDSTFASYLRVAKIAIQYLNDTPSATLQEHRDKLFDAYESFTSATVSDGEDVANLLKELLYSDILTEFLNEYGLGEYMDRIEALITLLEKSETLEIPSEVLSEAQDAVKELLNDEFWEKYQALIDFRALQEYTNPITGEVTIDDLTAEDYVEILNILGIELPINVTPEFVKLVMQADVSSLKYDADGSTNLNVYVKDIASVSVVSEFDSKDYINATPSVTLEVYGISGANTAEISKAVKKITQEFQSTSYVVLLDDQSQFVSDSIANVISSMIIGGVLAVLIILLFTRKVRTSLIIAITMPLSVLCTLICLYFMGITLNMVSLGGLAVGIGMLVDNSIVVIESITFERDKGKSALDAAVDGTKLVMSSLIASTLTSICVFFPILFTTGLTKMIFTDLSWSVIFSLTFSLIVAITVIPTLYCAVYNDKIMLGGRVFKAKKAKAKAETKTAEETTAAAEGKDAEIETTATAEEETTVTAATPEKKPKTKKRNFLARFYDMLLPLTLKHRWITLLIALVLFAGSVGLVFIAGTDFLPPVDQRTIEVKISYDAVDSLEYCERTTMDIYSKIYENVPEIKYISVNVGKNGMLTIANSGVIRIILDDKGRSTKAVLKDVRNIAHTDDLTVSVTEVDGVLASLMSGLGITTDITATITGPDFETMKEVCDKIIDTTMASDSRFDSVRTDISEEILEYKIVIDRMKCLQYGIDYQVAVASLRAGIAGYTACTAEIDDKSVNVVVRFSEGTIEDYYGGIENYVLGYDEGESIKLKDVALIQSAYTPTKINKTNGLYTVNIAAETAEGWDTGSASAKLLEAINTVVPQYEGFSVVEGGIGYYMNEVLGGLVISLIISFLLLFAVMACQFESLKKPFIVIFAIPFSFTGGFLALTIAGISLNVVSMFGLIMLMGVVVNDAIVMIDRIGQLEKEMSPYEAVIAGSKSRMRAIWMTTLTTVLALVPLALAIGKGSELMQPLGVVVIGGLLLATFVTLILIPVMYSILNRVKVPKN